MTTVGFFPPIFGRRVFLNLCSLTKNRWRPPTIFVHDDELIKTSDLQYFVPNNIGVMRRTDLSSQCDLWTFFVDKEVNLEKN